MPRIELSELERQKMAKAGADSIPCTHGWRPIETAPKDGTNILVYGNWTGDLKGIMSDDKEILIANWYSDDWYVEGSEVYSPTVTNATHWMPLPNPPQG